jgi:GntR family transcriptional regulator
MIIDIDTHGGIPIYRQVVDQVKRLILTGQLAEGQQLESVASLSSHLKVNPMTISKAYGLLVGSGLVVRRRGVGLFVAELPCGTEKNFKSEVLENALRKAASLAVQMDISEQEAASLFSDQLKKFKLRKRGNRNEQSTLDTD